MNKLVSIIVPVYNSEKNIERTINSILKQTHQNIELILVDDGSEDSSLKICEQQRELDHRIKICQQKNLGVSGARNTGIEISSGDFLIFVDSDDYIEENMIEVLLEHYVNQEDLVICGFYIHNLERKKDISLNKGNKEYKEMQITQLASNFWYFYENGITNSPCNKLYFSSIIKDNNIRFPLGVRMGEDIIFNLKYFSKVKQIKIIDRYLYHYMLSPTQSTRKVDLKISEDMIFFLKEIEIFINKNKDFTDYGKEWEAHNYQIYKHLLTALKMPYRTNKINNKERLCYTTNIVKRFKKEFQKCIISPHNSFDKLMIYYLHTSNYKKIHFLFKSIELTKSRLKLLIQVF